MRNFCAAKLQLLADKKGLLSSPLSRIIGKRSKEKGRLCFPCVVLEAKHHEVKQSSVENCYCQAANGAACALALLHNLTGKYIASDFKRDARPVVTITLNGHQARVWIAGIKSTKNASETIATEKGSQLREFTRVRYVCSQCYPVCLVVNEEQSTEVLTVDSICNASGREIYISKIQ